MNYTLRQLQIFSLFAKTLNVSQTAKIVNVSQSAISHSLHELEDELQMKLFLRQGNRLKLTPEGEALLPAIEGVLSQLQSLESQARHAKDARHASVSVASIESLGNWLIHEAVCRFMNGSPDIQLRFSKHSSVAVVDQVRNNAVDIGFTMQADDDTGVVMQPLLRSEVVCVLPARHRLVKEKDVVTLADLRDDKIITPGPHTIVGRLLIGVLTGSSRRSNSTLEINQTSTILSLVRSGLGVSLHHPFHALSRLDGISIRRFKPRIELSVMMVFPRGKPISPAARTFSTIVRDIALENVHQRSGYPIRLG